ncbi:MAG: LytTR family DNA-binding domain-containing protein [Bacteroidales bacterium]|nr:LytTR family DNA-binding domain-containing protein [Bacteroidales bacterium]
MKKIKCLILDDEPLALDLLEGYVLRTPFLELTEKCSDAFTALKYIGFGEIDLLFLDIQMPEFSGMELSRMLNREVRVIFTTAFQEFAVEGFKVDAVDYLLKPFNYNEFLKASVKAQDHILMKSIFLNKQQVTSVLFVQSESKLVKVQLDKILYIEGFKNHITIHVIDSERPIQTLMSLKELEEKLPKERFSRIHHSFIVNLSQIEALERNQVILGNERITLRDQYINKLDQYIRTRIIQE